MLVCSTFVKSVVHRQARRFCSFALDQERRRLIEKHTEISRDHLTPELALRLITPNCPIFNAAPSQTPDAAVPFTDPYWGFYWPGGQALARWILDNPDIVAGRGVVDFGCGCGAGSLAALRAECGPVLALDIDPDALLATGINLELNGMAAAAESRVDFNSHNYLGSDLSCDWSVFLVGDMFYSDELASEMHAWFRRLLSRDSSRTILIGDPGRWQFSNAPIKNSLELRATYSLPSYQLLENSLTASAVYMYRHELD